MRQLKVCIAVASVFFAVVLPTKLDAQSSPPSDAPPAAPAAGARKHDNDFRSASLDAARACRAIVALKGRIAAEDYAGLEAACAAENWDHAETLAKSLIVTLLDREDLATSVLVDLIKPAPKNVRFQTGADVDGCGLRAKLRGVVDYEILRRCRRLDPKQKPHDHEALLTLRVNDDEKVRVFSSGGEVETLRETVDGTGAVVAFVSKATPVLVVRRGEGWSSGWLPRSFMGPEALGSAIELYSAPSCAGVVLKGRAAPEHLLLDGSVVDLGPDARPRGRRMLLPAGAHEIVVRVGEGGLPVRRTIQLPYIPRGRTCAKEVVDLTRMNQVALVDLKVSERCSEVAVPSAAIAEAVRHYVGQKDEYHDAREFARVAEVLGRFDTSLTTTGGRGPLSFDRPIDQVAKDLFGAGIGNALLVAVECGGTLQAPIISVTVARVDTLSAWTGRREDFVREASTTVGGVVHLRRAVETALARAFGRYNLQVRNPTAWDYYSPRGLRVLVDIPTDDDNFEAVEPGRASKPKKKLDLELRYVRSGEGDSCDAVQQRNSLAAEGLSLQSDEELALAEQIDVPKSGTYELPFRPHKPGSYVVAVVLRAATPPGAVVLASERRCVMLHEPKHWFRLEAGYLRKITGALDASTNIGHIRASWYPQPRELPVAVGLEVGYAMASHTAAAPPSWDDLAATADRYRGSGLELGWQRHSVLLGPTFIASLDPARHLGVDGEFVNLRAFFEVGAALDVGFLVFTEVPPELTTFRPAAKVEPDFDATLTLKAGIGGRLPGGKELAVVGYLQSAALDDWFLSANNRALNDAMVSAGVGTIWGLGL